MSSRVQSRAYPMVAELSKEEFEYKASGYLSEVLEGRSINALPNVGLFYPNFLLWVRDLPADQRLKIVEKAMNTVYGVYPDKTLPEALDALDFICNEVVFIALHVYTTLSQYKSITVRPRNATADNFVAALMSLLEELGPSATCNVWAWTRGAGPQALGDAAGDHTTMSS